MSVSFWLQQSVAVSVFIICNGFCACTKMLWMCGMHVSYGFNVMPRTVYSAGSVVNRVQFFFLDLVWDCLFCPGKNFMLVWLYVFLGYTRACVWRCDGDVICIGRPWPEPVLWVVVCLQCKYWRVLVKGRHLVVCQFWWCVMFLYPV